MARSNIAKSVQLAGRLPPGLGRRIQRTPRAKSQLNVIGPLTVFLIFLILFALYGNFKFPFIIVLGVVLTEPVGG